MLNCNPNFLSQLRTTNQQVHWVVQVINLTRVRVDATEIVSIEASYGHLVNLSQENSNGYGDIRIKHKDKDRDTYVIHWWEFQISA